MNESMQVEVNGYYPSDRGKQASTQQADEGRVIPCGPERGGPEGP